MTTTVQKKNFSQPIEYYLQKSLISLSEGHTTKCLLIV